MSDNDNDDINDLDEVRLPHFNESYINVIMNSPEWTKAIFVRNPHERILSAYLDKACHVRFLVVNYFGRRFTCCCSPPPPVVVRRRRSDDLASAFVAEVFHEERCA